MRSKGVTEIITAIIGIVIALVVLTALAPTVISQTSTTGALANASATGKTMYSLIEFLYPIVGVLFMVGVGFGLGRKL